MKVIWSKGITQTLTDLSKLISKWIAEFSTYRSPSGGTDLRVTPRAAPRAAGDKAQGRSSNVADKYVEMNARGCPDVRPAISFQLLRLIQVSS